MIKGLSTVRKLLTMLAGATAGGLIQLSFQSTTLIESPQQESPVNVLPHARTVTQERLPATSAPPPALLEHPDPDAPHSTTSFAVRPASASRAVADGPDAAPTHSAHSPPRELLKSTIHEDCLSPIGSQDVRRTCRPLMKRLRPRMRRR